MTRCSRRQRRIPLSEATVSGDWPPAVTDMDVCVACDASPNRGQVRDHFAVAEDVDLIDAYRAGATAAELAEHFDVTPRTVLNRLARAGVARRPRGRRGHQPRLQDRAWLVGEYGVNGRSAADVAREVGCSETAVLEALHRHGIAVRTRGGGARRAPMPAELRDAEWLSQTYASGLSIRLIARQLGVSGSAVAAALRRAGVTRRAVGNTRPPRTRHSEAPIVAPVGRPGRHPQPVGMLPDGTEYFVPLGRLEFVDDGRRVLCHLCGRPLRLLSTTHLRQHGWTPQEYREAFGLNRSTPLCAPAVSERRRVIGRDRYAANARVREGMARGQELVRSGTALRQAHAAMPPGSARLQRRMTAADVTAEARERRHLQAVARRRERIRGLGFATERAYLRDRYLRRGWGIARIKAEMQVGSGVVEQLLDAAGIARRPPGGRR